MEHAQPELAERQLAQQQLPPTTHHDQACERAELCSRGGAILSSEKEYNDPIPKMGSSSWQAVQDLGT